MIRRRDLVAAAALAPWAGEAAAQRAWPTRPIRLVVPFAPGGTTDIVARILAQHMQEKLGQPVVVENRPGAGATLASGQVARAAADGYTLIISNVASHGIAPSLFREIPYDAVRDFTHIALVATNSNAVLVNPRFEAQSIAALVALGRRQGSLDFAVSSYGTSNHLLGMRFGLEAGIRMNPIAYRGSGPALADTVAGVVGLMFDSLPSSIGFIRGGQLNALAVADEQRSRFLPEVPTLVESGFPGLTTYSWFGLSGPAGMRPEIVHRLNAVVQEVLRLPAVIARYQELTADAPATTPEQFAAYVAQEVPTWAEVVRRANITIN